MKNAVIYESEFTNKFQQTLKTFFTVHVLYVKAALIVIQKPKIPQRVFILQLGC